MKKKNDTAVLIIRVSKYLKTQLFEIARENELSVSDLVRHAIYEKFGIHKDVLPVGKLEIKTPGGKIGQKES